MILRTMRRCLIALNFNFYLVGMILLNCTFLRAYVDRKFRRGYHIANVSAQCSWYVFVIRAFVGSRLARSSSIPGFCILQAVKAHNCVWILFSFFSHDLTSIIGKSRNINIQLRQICHISALSMNYYLTIGKRLISQLDASHGQERRHSRNKCWRIF